MSFKKFYYESYGKHIINEGVELNFCYMVYPEQPYIDYIGEIQHDLFSGKDIVKEAVKPEDLHCTMLFVKLNYGQDPDKFIDWLSNTPLPVLNAFTNKFSIFDKKTLVVELDSPELRNWYEKVHSWAINEGYSDSDYKIYRPHISLGYGYINDDPPNFDIRTHRLKLKLPKHIVTNQNYDKLFNQISDQYDPNIGFGILD